MKRYLFFLGSLISLVVIIYLLSYFFNRRVEAPVEDASVFCTMEAKICSDGETYVGRIAPYCNFAPCPDELDLSEDNLSQSELTKDCSETEKCHPGTTTVWTPRAEEDSKPAELIP